jgi:tRNA(Ile)-lysidine synthase
VRIDPAPGLDLGSSVLDERLLADDPTPLAVAFSGGGDSLLLLLAAKAWADRRRRRLIALTVDHRLRPEGAAWALWCRQRALRLDVDHRILVWDGEKPVNGRSAAARRARHRLLAEAAREAGAVVILMGHTADDRAEAAFMRAAGSNVPTPRTWSPSPAWPEGRGLFLLRPLLGVGRAELRTALAALGETWIEDPANQDLGSVRARARIRLQGGPVGVAAPDPAARRLDMVTQGAAGDLFIPRGALVNSGRASSDLGAALLCAGGGDRPPRGDSLRRLLEQVEADGRFIATLAGARLQSADGGLHIVREAGDERRARSVDMHLPIGRPVVWDGRFELRASAAGARVGRLAGRAAGLPTTLRRAILTVPPASRPSLPLVSLADGAMALPTLIACPFVEARALALARLTAALGAIVNEAGLRWMAETARPS